MRRRKRSRQVIGVSLFPFLAVLICTLGVLIVLLVIAVKAADVHANQARDQSRDQIQEHLDELKWQTDLKQVQIDGLIAARPDVTRRLADAKLHRGHLENEIRELKRKALELARQLQAIESDPVPEVNAEQARNDITDLQAQVEQAQAELESRRQALQQSGPSAYVIVPHQGSGGTYQRPIYVECTSEAIVLQPSGIELKKSDFAMPVESGNVLDSALLAIREYWQRFDIAGEKGSPYPLLVVRPEGAETYFLARLAMKSWDDQFGYELVEADKTLDFGIVDQQLKQELHTVITEARRRSNSRQLAQRFGRPAENLANPGSTPGIPAYGTGAAFRSKPKGLTASSRTGGFVVNSDWKTSAGEFAKKLNGSESNKEHHSTTLASYPLNGTAGSPKQTAQNDSRVPGDLPHGATMPGSTSLAAQRGKNWALPSRTPGATGYVRPIRVLCHPDSLEIRSAVGTEATIDTQKGLNAAIDPLVNEIWNQIESWGVSGAGSYWIPQLRVTVLPGGESKMDQLRQLLNDSGIVIKEHSE